MRLDKLLSDCGFGTRKEVKKVIRNGWVSVNGEIIKKDDFKVDEFNDEIYVDDQLVTYVKYVYYMLNKPAGVISASNDPNCETVVDLIDSYVKDLFCVGRLDKDTVGLCLITNDGPLAHDLLAPKKHIEKEYIVHSESELSIKDIERLENGITIDHDEKCKPCTLKVIEPCVYSLCITEGKFHQIKRMFEAVDNKVVYLKRIRMKNLLLDSKLKEGESRLLTEDEIENLKQIL